MEAESWPRVLLWSVTLQVVSNSLGALVRNKSVRTRWSQRLINAVHVQGFQVSENLPGTEPALRSFLLLKSDSLKTE
jgi:hypothetical protein